MIPVLSSAAREPPMKKASPSPSSFPLESLPDDLAMNCIARVSCPDLAALPFVSKRYRSLAASSDFKKMRSQLGCTEERLYVCLNTFCNPNHIWYVIHRETLNFVNGLVMSPIPLCPSPWKGSSVVVLDWGIYVIGGYLNWQSTSDVWLLDCRTNTWRNIPSMRTARAGAVAGVVDGKIYVFGGNHRMMALEWGEVFDPKTQTWDALVTMPDRGEVDDEFGLYSMVMEEKVYGVNLTKGSVVYYAPSEGKWGREIRPDLIEIDDNPLCLILCGCGENLGNLLYGYDVILGGLIWRESDEKKWKRVKGLEPRFMGEKWIYEVHNIGLNVVFIWFENKNESVEIWCCEISLKRIEERGEVWGTIEWLGVVGSLYDMHYRDPFGGVLYSAHVNV